MKNNHEEFSATINASPDRVFDHLDDQTRLTEHMNRRSWKMAWGKMETQMDAGRGRAVGSHIVLTGRVLGMRLFLDEVVTVREPTLKKAWETVGEPRLLVVGPYSMSFHLEAAVSATRLRVAIDYDAPSKGISRVLGSIFGRSYAKGCVKRMVRDAETFFNS